MITKKKKSTRPVTLTLEIKAIDYGDLCRASVLLGNTPEDSLREFVGSMEFSTALSDWVNKIDK